MELDGKMIGNRIKEIRESLNMSQKEFAKLVDTSFRAIQSYEIGTSIPGGKALFGMAEKGLNINWILTGEGKMYLLDTYTDYPVLSDLKLLEDTLKTVDEYFSRMNISLPDNLREIVILDIYKKVQRKKTELNSNVVSDVFTSILSKFNGGENE